MTWPVPPLEPGSALTSTLRTSGARSSRRCPAGTLGRGPASAQHIPTDDDAMIKRRDRKHRAIPLGKRNGQRSMWSPLTAACGRPVAGSLTEHERTPLGAAIYERMGGRLRLGPAGTITGTFRRTSDPPEGALHSQSGAR